MAGRVAAVRRPGLLLDFEDDREIELFTPVNDAVMGGQSRSRFERAAPGIARFAGFVSLANFGGFASVRTPPRYWGTAEAVAFSLRARGDGRTFKFTVRTDDGFDGVQYQCRFESPANEWNELRPPVAAFMATFRGRPMPGAGPLDPGRVRSIGFMISDKQAGPFELLLDWIAVERD
jgi:NADH dehydrogenase [ubiquinone] 1 alpha subcomplex assembly factor 1